MQAYIEHPFAATAGQLHEREAGLSETPFTGMSDQVIDYILAMQPAFDDLRDAISQLGALLLLAATGNKAVGDHPMLFVAVEACRRGRDQALSVPTCSGAAEHARHVKQAIVQIGEVATMLSESRTMALQVGMANSKLKCGYRHLHTASCQLEGFELVDLSQACCAEHS